MKGGWSALRRPEDFIIEGRKIFLLKDKKYYHRKPKPGQKVLP